MKESTLYFSHDFNSSHDEKIIRLRMKFGWEGVGIFWGLVEKLHAAEGILKFDCEGIAYDMQSQCERIKSIICDFDLFEVDFEKNIFFSKRIIENINYMKEKSKKAKISALKRWNKNQDVMSSADATAMRPQCDRNAILQKIDANAMLINEIKGNKIKEKIYKKEKNYELENQAIEILQFLNKKTSRNYPSNDANLNFIKSRLKEGATLSDCKSIIAKKTREWITDEKMNLYLRPATLFNKTKFAQYQGELIINEKENESEDQNA